MTCTITSSRRDWVRSIKIPAKRVKMVTGRAWAMVTKASAAGEPVRSRTSQAWVVRKSQPPHWAIAALTKYVRKLGTDRADLGTDVHVGTPGTNKGDRSWLRLQQKTRWSCAAAGTVTS